MALGLTARVVRKAHWDRGSKLQFLVIAAITAEDLNWKVEQITQDSLVVHSRVSIRSAGEEIRISFHKGEITIKSECIGIQPFAFGKNNSNIKKFFKRFKEVSMLTTDQDIVKHHFALKQKAQENTVDITPVITNSKEKLSNFFALFFSKKDFYFTSKILALNTLVYIVMAMTGAFSQNHIYEALYSFGGIHRGLINDGEWWRLITYGFVHGGFLHLFFNMYAFLYVSLLLEPLLGRFQYLAVYLSLVFLSGLSSIYWFSNILSVGASGAIFGLYGLTFAFAATGILRNRIRISLLISIAIFSGYNIIFGIEDGIDYAAHIGGISWGFIMGLLLTPFYKDIPKRFYRLSSSVLLAVLIMGFAAYINIYIQKNPSILIKPNPLIVFISDANNNIIVSNSAEYKDLKSLMPEINQFWRNYRKVEKAGDFTQTNPKLISLRLKAAITLLDKEIKTLYHLLNYNLPPLARAFITDAAYSCDAKSQLYQGYLKAIENSKYNYRKSLSPLIARAQFTDYRINANEYYEFKDCMYY